VKRAASYRKYKKKKKPKQKSLGDNYTEIQYRPYALAIGQANLAWNDLHLCLCSLFGLSNGGNSHVFENTLAAIWHSSGNDRTCRNMLRATVLTPGMEATVRFPSLPESLGWLLGRADSLEDARNDLIHSPFTRYDPVWLLSDDLVEPPLRVQPAKFTGHVRAKKLAKNADVLRAIRLFREETLVLRDFALHLVSSMMFPEHFPWPEIPQLPNRGEKSGPRHK